MCETCNELDKIEHYEKIAFSLSDQLTVDRIKALIATEPKLVVSDLQLQAE